MSTGAEQADVEALRARVEALERENAELAARANAAIAAAQDRVYWLDRWGIDLNALMRKPGASQLLAILRVLRTAARRVARVTRRSAG